MKKPSFIVSDSPTGKKISAYIILRPSGELCAKVRILHTETCKVEAQVWNKDETYGLFNNTAGGSGYNKAHAALNGLTIDGIRVYDDCEAINWQEEYPELCERVSFSPLRVGVCFGSALLESWYAKFPTNNSEAGRKVVQQIETAYPDLRLCNFDRDTGRYKSLYVVAGLDRLKARGYQVIQAI